LSSLSRPINQQQDNKVKEKGQRKGMSWTTFALMTVLFWGVYGVLLHAARGYMPGVTPPGPEGAHAGLKAFLFVCVAYGITGVIALVVLKARGSDFSFTGAGINWSIIAGLAGALGAFTLVLSLGAAGPIYKAAAAGAVMPIVFGGAPIVNAIVSMWKQGASFKSLPMPFVLGIILAATGGFLVAKFAPTNTGAASHGPAPTAQPAAK
jgi:hypothetical protein